MALPPELMSTGRELAAFARQAWLLRHDVTRPSLPRRAAAGDHVVVCLHGLFATAGVLRPLRRRLERLPGVHTAALTYPPGPGIADLAERLHEVVRALPEHGHLHLVGHSVGGVVSRYYALHRRPPRLVQTISLASPFAGVRSARLLGLDVGRDLDPRSALLRELRLGDGVPHLSLLAADDAVVRRPLSHALPTGEVAVIAGCGHNHVLYHPDAQRRVEARIVDAIRRLEGAAAE